MRTMRLREALEKAIKIIGQKQVINLLHGLDDGINEKKIAIHVGDKVRFVPSGEVFYIEVDGRYCRLFTKNSETYVTSKYLKDFEAYFLVKTLLLCASAKPICSIRRTSNRTAKATRASSRW